MRRTALIVIVLASVLSLGQAAAPAAAAGSPSVVQPEALTWAPAAGLPPGAEAAVLYGDPAKTGPFAVRFKFPAGYEVATHSHPTDEFVTVISGKGRMAFGEDAAEANARPLAAGTFTSLPGGAWHHLWIDAETVVELHSTGPFGVDLLTK